MPPNLIQDVLTEENLTGKELAGRLGVSPTAVTKWGKGEPIPAKRLKQLWKMFPWTSSIFDSVCGGSANADEWRQFLAHCAVDAADETFESYYLDDIAYTFAAIGVNLKISPYDLQKQIASNAEEGAAIDPDSSDFDEEISLKDVITDAIRDSGWAAVYARHSAGCDDHPDLLEESTQVESVGRRYSLARWLSDDAKQLLGVDKDKWSAWYGETRLQLWEAISDYLSTRRFLGLPIDKDPFPLEHTEPEELIYDIQDMGWEKKWGVEGHFSLAERSILGRLVSIEESLARLIKHVES